MTEAEWRDLVEKALVALVAKLRAYPDPEVCRLVALEAERILFPA